MNFFNIGAGEFFLILVVLMIVFGPQRLPQLARQVGKLINDVRKFASEIDPELLQDFREVTKDLESVRAEMTSLRSDIADIQRDVTVAAKDVSESLNEVIHEVETSTSLTTPPHGATTAVGSGPRPSGVTATAAARTAQAQTSGAQVAAAAAASQAMVAPTSTATASPVVGQEDEIVGTPVLLYGPGDGAFLDEIVGTKVFPLPRHAAHVVVPEPNGHDEQAPMRSRDALMVSLVQRRQPAPRVAPRAPIRPRTRERTTRRG
ncbi:MAG: Sec-independent protein translocase subunit TatA/TatB [Anaerolineae bacterium]